MTPPPPLWNFSENSSGLVGPPVPKLSSTDGVSDACRTANIFIHFHQFSSTFINFIHFHPFSSTFIDFHPFSSTFIHFYPPAPTCINLHSLYLDTFLRTLYWGNFLGHFFVTYFWGHFCFLFNDLSVSCLISLKSLSLKNIAH